MNIHHALIGNTVASPVEFYDELEEAIEDQDAIEDAVTQTYQHGLERDLA